MESKQIIGWLFIFLGAGIIIWTLYGSFQIFSGKEPPPRIFVMEPQSATRSASGSDLQKQAEEAVAKLVQEQLRGLVPADSVAKLLNLLSWSTFAWILIFGGGQISGLGSKLIK